MEGTTLRRAAVRRFPDFPKEARTGAPLHRQIRDVLRRSILEGELAAGSALPSTRWLASHWGVARNTVLTAYDELTAEGLVVGRMGSGTRVWGAPARVLPPDPRRILRESHYPAGAVACSDPDGNPLYLHRPDV